MRNLVLLTSPMVGITVTLLMARRSAEHSQHVGTFKRYYFPSVYKWTGFCVAVLFCAFPLLPGVVGDTHPLLFYVFYYSLSIACFAGALYLAKYRLTVGSDMFTVGAFWIHTYSLKEIVSSKLVRGRKADKYFVHMRNGKAIRISGLLTDFDEIQGSLYAPIEEAK